MPEIYLPSKIIYGKNSIDKINVQNHEHAILLSDGGSVSEHGYLDRLQNNCLRILPQVTKIVNTNVNTLYSEASEAYFSNEADLIIAAGSPSVIDCAMLMSHESSADFIAIPLAAATGMTDFESADYSHYRKAPDCIVLDPSLILCADSATIAYNSLACLSYALEALSNSGSLVSSMATDSAVRILHELPPSFRGNIASLESLMYAMYTAVVAHRNKDEISSSLLNRTASFFSKFGYPKESVCAVIMPYIAEYEAQKSTASLAEIARALNLCIPEESCEDCCKRLIDHLRKLQASVAVPRSISAFGLGEESFKNHLSSTDLPVELLELCYRGGFSFSKV